MLEAPTSSESPWHRTPPPPQYTAENARAPGPGVAWTKQPSKEHVIRPAEGAKGRKGAGPGAKGGADKGAGTTGWGAGRTPFARGLGVYPSFPTFLPASNSCGFQEFVGWLLPKLLRAHRRPCSPPRSPPPGKHALPIATVTVAVTGTLNPTPGLPAGPLSPSPAPARKLPRAAGADDGGIPRPAEARQL